MPKVKAKPFYKGYNKLIPFLGTYRIALPAQVMALFLPEDFEEPHRFARQLWTNAHHPSPERPCNCLHLAPRDPIVVPGQFGL